MAAGLGGVGFAEGVTMASQFVVQLIGVGATAVWSIVASYVLIKITQMAVGLRVDPEIETQGLDLSTHGETGYNVALGGTLK
jgi:Amt family ammonium transporter